MSHYRIDFPHRTEPVFVLDGYGFKAPKSWGEAKIRACTPNEEVALRMQRTRWIGSDSKWVRLKLGSPDPIVAAAVAEAQTLLEEVSSEHRMRLGQRVDIDIMLTTASGDSRMILKSQRADVQKELDSLEKHREKVADRIAGLRSS